MCKFDLKLSRLVGRTEENKHILHSTEQHFVYTKHSLFFANRCRIVVIEKSIDSNVCHIEYDTRGSRWIQTDFDMKVKDMKGGKGEKRRKGKGERVRKETWRQTWRHFSLKCSNYFLLL